MAGPSGACKSTFFDVFLRLRGFRFVNADLIAHGLPGDDREEAAYRAAELAEIERWALVARGDTFVMETAFSDPAGAKLDVLRDARLRGYRVAFVYIGLAGTALSQARVIKHVAQGGHDVPDDEIRERLPCSLENAKRALQFVDAAWVLDNSDAESSVPPRRHHTRGIRDPHATVRRALVSSHPAEERSVGSTKR